MCSPMSYFCSKFVCIIVLHVRIKVMMMIKYFSGLTLVHFTALSTFLGDAVNNLIYWNSGATATTGTSTKKGSTRQT